MCQRDQFATNEKRPVAIASAGSAFDLRQCRCRHEADELEVRRSRVHRLQLGKQSARGGTSSTDIDAAASPDLRQSPLHRNKLRAEIGSTQARRAATRYHATPPVNLSRTKFPDLYVLVWPVSRLFTRRAPERINTYRGYGWLCACKAGPGRPS